LGTGHGQPARPGTDRQRQSIEVEHAATGRPGRPWRTASVERDHLDRLARHQRDVLPGEEFGRPQPQLLEFRIAM
jgi:hypothetical protein